MTEVLSLPHEPGDQLSADGNANDTLYDDIHGSFATHGFETIVFICIYGVTFIVALVGNLLVLLVVLMNKNMRNTTNYFLVNLAVADLLVTLVCIPMTVAQKMYTIWFYGEFLCKITDYLQGISICASVLTIVVMSLERFAVICYPMYSRKFCTTGVIQRGIFVIWIASGVIMIPLIMVKRFDVVSLDGGENLTFCREQWPSHAARQAYDSFLLCFIYVVPGCVVITLYMKIGMGLWRTSATLRRGDSCLSNSRNVVHSRRRIASMMIMISFLFAVCWLPYYIVVLYLDFNDVDNSILRWLSYALLLGHSNSAQNPLLYCCMHRGFSSATRKVCCKPRSRHESRPTTPIIGRGKSANGETSTRMNLLYSSGRHKSTTSCDPSRASLITVI